MTISATRIADLVQNGVNAKKRVDDLAQRIVDFTGCTTAYWASNYANRNQWSYMPEYPMIGGNVSALTATTYNISQRAFKQSVNQLLEEVNEAENDALKVNEQIKAWVKTLPDAQTELFFYVIYDDATYKIGYKWVQTMTNVERGIIFEQVEEM